MTGQRYFRTTEATYESARRTIDAAFCYPSAAAATCITPAAGAPRLNGFVVVAVRRDLCALLVVAKTLGRLIASGDVVEITQAEYAAAMQRGTP